jgi:hypothetical protein
MDIQRVNSKLLREVLTNVYHVNKPGHAVWEQGVGENTIDDLLTTRVGRIARFARPVNESYQAMTVPFTAQASFPIIEFFDKAKRERTGVSNDSQGLSPEALKNVQTTVLAQASDIGRMKIEVIARVFAETGIKSLFLHIHELVLKYQNKPEIVKLRNEWVEVNPTEWKTRLDMTVNIGLGIGTREQNLMHLEAIWNKQKDVVTAGGFGTLVTPMNVYNTAAEIVKNANLKNPHMFFTPTDEVSPPNDEQAALQKQEQELQARQQQLDGERQQIAAAKLQLQGQQQQLEAEKTKFELQLETKKLQLDSGELQRKREADKNDVMLAIEGLRNELTQMSLQYSQPVQGAQV